MSTKTANPVDALVEAYTTSVEKANAIAEQVGASKGNHAKSLKEFRETSDAPEVVAFREWLEKAQAAINARVEEINALGAKELGFKNLSEEEADALKEQYKPLAEKAKKAKGLLSDMADLMGLEIPELPELKRFSGGKSGAASGSQTGIKRPRWDRVEVDGEEVKNGDKPGTLSLVSALIKKESGVSVSAKDLQHAIFEAAGTDDMNKISDVEIVWTEGEHKWTITVYKSHEDDEA